ncbi:MAG TPA: MBL fold metallo-hydrolase, partial [Kofleriaceae bacterium]|nr:MBL fold metallo-hydrolase [Kofleriaceae bacterium]
SPDVRQQIEACPALHPRATRDTPIAGVLLASGDLDACLGLLSLRESQPLAVYGTAAVLRGFADGSLHRTLARVPGQVSWRPLALGADQALAGPDGRPCGLSIAAFPVPGKVPLHRAGLQEPGPEDTVALRVRDRARGQTLLWAPSVAGPAPVIEPLLREAELALFDGTFWSADELERAGAGGRRAEEMGHWPLGGPAGSLALLARVPARSVLVHINNTNPILVEDSPERAAVAACGVEVAEDGMEVWS